MRLIAAISITYIPQAILMRTAASIYWTLVQLPGTGWNALGRAVAIKILEQ
jgi:hypothetical protein